MRSILIYLFIILGIYSISSCYKSEDISNVDQSTIYPKYSVKLFDGDSIQTRASACFLDGGPNSNIAIKLDVGSIAFNGSELSNDTMVLQDFFGSNEAVGTAYRTDFVPMVQNGEFKFYDADGTLYTNTIPFINTISPVNTFVQLPLSTSITLSWDGLPVQPNEEICFSGVVFGWGNDCQTEVGATTINLEVPEALASDTSMTLINSIFELRFFRKHNSATADNPNGEADGGELQTTYISQPFTVEIIE